ncbi:MAG: efflux transporter periplasmic adaptor subunit, partial [Pseudomonadota bacterium]|nr:efflux transporter periplasmic adaptor subunit [Pseudomonadota bacterium]
PGVRGSDVSGGEPMVAVKGLAENAMVVLGAVGSLREGTAVKFTQAPAWTAPATSAASSPKAL